MYKGKKKKMSNRSRILECLYRNAPIARTEIADETEITPATVTANVTALIGEGIVTELGEVTEDGVSGRRRVLIDIRPEYAFVVGVEFTLKALVICITDLKGTCRAKRIWPFCEKLAKTITEQIVDGTKQLVAATDIKWKQIIGIGIAVPGHMSGNQESLITNRKTWRNFSPERLEKEFSVPVVMENNARCMALKEYLFRPAESPDSFAFFHVGMGMFCANIVDGELFLGNNYVAGEIGHTIVHEGGRRCECGKYGCLQMYSSETWLLKCARLLYDNDPETILRSLAKTAQEITIDTVATAYSMGDRALGGYITQALRYLGITTSNIAIIMNPGKIFLHGRLFGNRDIRNELMDFIERQLLFVDRNDTNNIEILPYDITDGAVGAAALAVGELFIKDRPTE